MIRPAAAGCREHLYITLVLAMFVGAFASPAYAQESTRDPGFVVDRFVSDIRIDTIAGGLVVREQIILRLGERKADRFDRVIREPHQDGVVAVLGSVDGTRWSEGNGPGHISVTGQDPLRVRFGIGELRPGTHEVTLEYRVVGSVGVEGAHGTVRWPAVPANRGYVIGIAEVRWEAPAGTIFYPATGIAEAEWTVAHDGDAFVATRAAVPAPDGGTVLAEFATDASTLPRPRWQDDEDQARLFTPAFLSGGLFILVVAAGILWIVRFQYPSERVRTADAAAPVDAGPAAMAVTLARRGRLSPLMMLGTVVDLGSQGAIAIQPGEGSVMRFAASAVAARLAHERVVMEALTTTGADMSRLRFRGALFRARGRFQHALVDDLVSEGLADPERLNAARNLRVTGLVSCGLAALFAGVVWLTLRRYGPWPYMMPVSMVIGGVALFIGGAAFSPLTAAGERASAAWRQRLRWLRGLRPASADAEPIDAASRWLPLAAAVGYGSRWLDLFKSRPVDVKGGLRWWTPRGESRADEMRRWLKELERDARPKLYWLPPQ